MKADIHQILSQMTLEEKASLCSGRDFWNLKDIERLGIPSIMVTDGPHGLRKQISSPDHVGLSNSVPATCFPTASASACSWDRDLMAAIGRALGEECQQEQVAVILGPGANIKRSPLCGRNFEYFSEDPFLSGEMAGSLIQGIQSQGIGTSLKHFAVNNQEHLRMSIDVAVDDRAFHEIYLASFERAVKKAQPWTVMCAYNKLDGIFCSENGRLLNTILREEWGFQGVVVTDWGACNDRTAGLIAGQDLEMPASRGENDALIVKAVKDGSLPAAALDRTVERLLRLIFTTVENQRTGYQYDRKAHHALARKAETESIVLLKNEGQILPLSQKTKIALIGAFADHPRYQGSGSSLMAPSKMEPALECFSNLELDFTYSPGYNLKNDSLDTSLIQAACEAARSAAVAVVFVGLPDAYEIESIDRDSLQLPLSHTALIDSVCKANPNTIIVLSNGAPVEMPWMGSVKAVLEGYLGGQASGSGMVDVLFGFVNPSGKLAETFPIQLEDTPAFHYFPGGPKTVEYRESIFVGYRYYDSARKPVLFPFGFGLSYTQFQYSGLEISKARISENEMLKVSINIKNSGNRAGAEIVQLYVRDLSSTAFRPEKELKGFEKVFLQPGEEKTVEFNLDSRAFAFYNPAYPGWQVESGDFDILVGASSADIRTAGRVWVDSTHPDTIIPDLRQAAPTYYQLPPDGFRVQDSEFEALYGKTIPSNLILPGEKFTVNSTLGEIRRKYIGRKLFEMIFTNAQKSFGEDSSDTTRKMVNQVILELPLKNLKMFSNGQITSGMIRALIMLLNDQWLKGIAHLILELIKGR